MATRFSVAASLSECRTTITEPDVQIDLSVPDGETFAKMVAALQGPAPDPTEARDLTVQGRRQEQV